jgi:hypothetical protein
MGEVLPVSSFNQSKPMKFIIDRTKWLRGGGFRNSALLRETDGLMCCLGQVGAQCGIPEAALRNIPNPDGVANEFVALWPKQLLNEDDEDSVLACAMMSTNDSMNMTEAEREEDLVATCEPYGIELEFVN